MERKSSKGAGGKSGRGGGVREEREEQKRRRRKRGTGWAKKEEEEIIIWLILPRFAAVQVPDKLIKCQCTYLSPSLSLSPTGDRRRRGGKMSLVP